MVRKRLTDSNKSSLLEMTFLSPYQPILNSIVTLGENVIPIASPLILNLDECRYEIVMEDSGNGSYAERLTWNLENGWSICEKD